MGEAKEVTGTAVVGSGEAAELLEFAEAALDANACATSPGVVLDEPLVRAIRRDDGVSAYLGDELAKGVGLVGEDGLWPETLQQGWRREDVAGLV
jgi:hypothetical protein